MQTGIDLDERHVLKRTRTMIPLILKNFRGRRLGDTRAEVVAEKGLERAHVNVDVDEDEAARISVGDRGVRTSYLIPDNKTADPRVLDREVSVLTAEG